MSCLFLGQLICRCAVSTWVSGSLPRNHHMQAAMQANAQALQAGACGRERGQRVRRPALSVVPVAGAAPAVREFGGGRRRRFLQLAARCFDSWQVERRCTELEHDRRQQVEARLSEAMRRSVTTCDCHAGETCLGLGAEGRGRRSWRQGVVRGRFRRRRRSRPRGRFRRPTSRKWCKFRSAAARSLVRQICLRLLDTIWRDISEISKAMFL